MVHIEVMKDLITRWIVLLGLKDIKELEILKNHLKDRIGYDPPLHEKKFLEACIQFIKETSKENFK